MRPGRPRASTLSSVSPLLWTLMAFDVSLVWRRVRLHALILYTCEGYVVES